MFDDIIKSAKENQNEKTDSAGQKTLVNETTSVSEPSSTADDFDSSAVRINVIGVGGAGCNSVDRLTRTGIKSARTIAINTDGKHLNMIKVHKKILLGKVITRGLGAGGYMEVARKCAEADRAMLKKELGDAELTFICAGMGGGTGGGAAPVIAQIAKEQGSIVVAIVTYPFKHERVRLKKAQDAINELTRYADTVIVIDNNRLLSYAPNLQIDKAFEFADSVAARAVIGIADTIMFPSLMNIDFADVRSVMQGGGLSLISLGEGNGVDRVETVVRDTLNHPLLDVNYEGAKGCLLHIEGGPDLTLGEAIKISEKLTDTFDAIANVKVGARIVPTTDKIKVTAIITGVSSPYILKKDETGVATEETLHYI